MIDSDYQICDMYNYCELLYVNKFTHIKYKRFIMFGDYVTDYNVFSNGDYEFDFDVKNKKYVHFYIKDISIETLHLEKYDKKQIYDFVKKWIRKMKIEKIIYK